MCRKHWSRDTLDSTSALVTVLHPHLCHSWKTAKIVGTVEATAISLSALLLVESCISSRWDPKRKSVLMQTEYRHRHGAYRLEWAYVRIRITTNFLICGCCITFVHRVPHVANLYNRHTKVSEIYSISPAIADLVVYQRSHEIPGQGGDVTLWKWLLINYGKALALRQWTPLQQIWTPLPSLNSQSNKTGSRVAKNQSSTIKTIKNFIESCEN